MSAESVHDQCLCSHLYHAECHRGCARHVVGLDPTGQCATGRHDLCRGFRRSGPLPEQSSACTCTCHRKVTRIRDESETVEMTMEVLATDEEANTTTVAWSVTLLKPLVFVLGTGSAEVPNE